MAAERTTARASAPDAASTTTRRRPRPCGPLTPPPFRFLLSADRRPVPEREPSRPTLAWVAAARTIAAEIAEEPQWPDKYSLPDEVLRRFSNHAREYYAAGGS